MLEYISINKKNPCTISVSRYPIHDQIWWYLTLAYADQLVDSIEQEDMRPIKKLKKGRKGRSFSYKYSCVNEYLLEGFYTMHRGECPPQKKKIIEGRRIHFFFPLVSHTTKLTSALEAFN